MLGVQYGLMLTLLGLRSQMQLASPDRASSQLTGAGSWFLPSEWQRQVCLEHCEQHAINSVQ